MKLNSSNEVFKEKMQVLKNSINDTVEKTFGVYNGNFLANNNEYANPTCGAIIDGTGQNTGNVNYHVSMKAVAHNHVTDPQKGHIGTFTLNDIIQLYDILLLAKTSNSPIKDEEFATYLTCNEGNYALKITDFQKLQTFALKVKTFETFKDKIDKFYKEKNMVHGEEKVKQNIGFLKLMKEYDIGVDYYEGDDNFENWKKLELNGNNPPTELPCN